MVLGAFRSSAHVRTCTRVDRVPYQLVAVESYVYMACPRNLCEEVADSSIRGPVEVSAAEPGAVRDELFGLYDARSIPVQFQELN